MFAIISNITIQPQLNPHHSVLMATNAPKTQCFIDIIEVFKFTALTWVNITVKEVTGLDFQTNVTCPF